MSIATKTFVIPTNPEDLKKIKDACQEISDCMIRIDSEREQIKEIISNISEKYELPKKIISKMAKAHYKNTFDKEAAEQEDFETLYEMVMRNVKNTES